MTTETTQQHQSTSSTSSSSVSRFTIIGEEPPETYFLRSIISKGAHNNLFGRFKHRHRRGITTPTTGGAWESIAYSPNLLGPMVTTTYYKTATTRTPSLPSTTVTENGRSSLQQTQKSSVTATRRSARLSREGRYRKAAAAAAAAEAVEEMSRTSVRHAAALDRVAITRSVRIKEECDDERSCYSDGMKKTSVECRGEAVSVVDRVLQDLRGDIMRKCREGSSSPSSEENNSADKSRVGSEEKKSYEKGRRGMKRRRTEVKEEEELPKRMTRNNRQGDLKGRLPFIPTPMRNDADAPKWLKELQKTTDWYCDEVEC